MEPIDDPKPILPKFSRADVTALLALFISMGALFVSIYEANILREQQEIMRTQQKISVLPYLVAKENFTFSEQGNEYTYAYKNKGIGPARISETRITINGDPVESYADVKKKIEEIVPEGIEFYLSFRNPIDYFLSEKEEITPMKLQLPRFEKDYAIIHSLNIKFDICYCSIYEDCWSLSSQDDFPKEGCEDSSNH